MSQPQDHIAKHQKIRRWSRVSSFLSILNGLASKSDRDYVRLRNHINRGKYTENLVASTKAMSSQDGRPFETIWLESPYGAYAVVKTKLPIDQRRIYQKLYQKPRIELKDAYSVLFSPYTEFLDHVLAGDPSAHDYPADRDVEAFTEVRAAYLEDDLVYQNDAQHGGHLIDMSWVQEIVHEHMAANEKRLKVHGTLLQTDENMYRSGSSIIWFRRNKKQPHKYDGFYYGNPAEGEDMLFMTEDMAYSGWVAGLLRLGSKKITAQPIDAHKRHHFARQSFMEISQKIIRHSDPYDIYAPRKGILAKAGHTVKREGLRLTQKMFHDVSTIDTHALGITLIGTAALTAMMIVYKLAAAVVVRVGELAMRGLNSMVKATSKYVVPPKTGTYRYLNDYAHLMGAQDKDAKSLVTKATKGRPIDPYFAKRSSLVPVEMLGAMYPDAKPFSNTQENQRVEGLLLDTTRYPCGTLISETSLQGRSFLKVEQPDGVVIYRDGEQQAALVQRPQKPLHGAYLDASVIRRFDELEDDQNILALRYVRGEGVTTAGFGDLEAALGSAFYPTENITSEAIARHVMDLDAQGRHHNVSVDDIVKRTQKTGMLTTISRKLFGSDEAARPPMPILQEPFYCFNNPACKPIFKKVVFDHPHRAPAPRLDAQRLHLTKVNMTSRF